MVIILFKKTTSQKEEEEKCYTTIQYQRKINRIYYKIEIKITSLDFFSFIYSCQKN